MKKSFIAASLALAAVTLAPLAVQAQNVAVVNGKPVPKARVDTIVSQVQKQAAQRNPAGAARPREDGARQGRHRRDPEPGGGAARPRRVGRVQVADGARAPEHPDRPALAGPRQDDQGQRRRRCRRNTTSSRRKPTGTEYKARHILVEKEDEAKAIVAQLKAGAKFEDLAKKSSKDPGSAPNGGDLDFAAPGSYVPEFSQAMTALKKGEYTETPVKTQFGYHIIKLEDTRAAQFPPLADVKPQIQQRLAQQKAAAFRDELRAKAKTDYKFTN